jgi:hypothetical protein
LVGIEGIADMEIIPGAPEAMLRDGASRSQHVGIILFDLCGFRIAGRGALSPYLRIKTMRADGAIEVMANLIDVARTARTPARERLDRSGRRLGGAIAGVQTTGSREKAFCPDLSSARFASPVNGAIIIRRFW